MSLTLTPQVTSKMSTAYSSGLSALIQAATSQLGDLGGGGEKETNAMEAGTVTMDTSVSGGSSSSSRSSSSRSIPTTPTLECEYYSRGVSDLDLDGTNNNRYYAAATAAATVTPLLTSISSYQHQHQHQGITSGGIDVRTSSLQPSTTFPMVLMNLLTNPAYEDIVTFLPDGKYFAIRRVDFTDLLLYNNFHLIRFNDFLELIIRWGFIRVNGNNSITIKADNNGNNDNDNDNNNSSNHWADIYVFRHPHFGMNQPVDMNKIKVRNIDMAVLPQIALQKCMREEELTNTSSSSSYSKNKKSVETTNTNNNKRQLSEDYHHHPRSRSSSSSSTNDDKSTMTPILLDPIYLSSSSNENYRDQASAQQQLRRRSSLELRSVAQAITASKLQLLHGCGGELVKESDIGSNNDYPGDNSSAPYLRHCADQQQERRQSTTSTTNLVDRGVETATQNIVTDAIEALLFDESHTRDTFMRHEKELSVSSLPGVVPISMQLFSENNDDDGKSSDTSSSSPSNNNDGGSKNNKSLGSCSRNKDRKSSTSSSSSKSKPKRKSNGKGRRKTSSSSLSSKLQSSWEINTTCAINSSLEDASRNNDVTNADTESTPEKLRVVIPPTDNSSPRQQRYVGSMMVVSPARMEAAAALVSQSRYNRTDGEFS